MEQGIKLAVNLDDNEKVFFSRELEHIKAKSYDVKYPQLKAKMLIPVSTEAGAGATSITYEQYDTVGMMKIISNYADDLPRADVKGKEFTTPVRSIGGSYGYNIQEIRSSALAGKNLQNRKALAVRKAYEEKVNEIAWSGKADDPKYAGLTGFIYNENIPTAVAVDGAGSSAKWEDKTAQEIYDDMANIFNGIVKVTKGSSVPDTLVLPLSRYSIAQSKIITSQTGETVLDWFKKNHPSVTVEWVNEFESVVSPVTGTGNVSIMACYRKSPEVLTLEIPSPFEQFKAQERNLEFVVPAHGRVGSVLVYYPLEVSIVEGI